MSNYQLPPNSNLVLTPEWAALAKIGKVFHWMYLLIIFSLLYILLLVVGGIAVGFPAVMDDPEALFEAHPIFLLFFLLGIFILSICSIVVGILMLIRIWNTPESIVPGGKIGRIYVILTIVNFVLGIFQGGMQAVDSDVAIALDLLGGIINLVLCIMFLIYMWRLADAVGSGRVKSCINWMVYGIIGCVVLGFLTGLLSAIESSIVFISGIALFILVLAIFLSYLNSFGYMAKDIEAFIEENCSRILSNPQSYPMNYQQGNPQGFPMNYQQGNPQGFPMNYQQGNPQGFPTNYPQGNPQGFPMNYPPENPQEIQQEPQGETKEISPE